MFSGDILWGKNKPITKASDMPSPARRMGVSPILALILSPWKALTGVC